MKGERRGNCSLFFAKGEAVQVILQFLGHPLFKTVYFPITPFLWCLALLQFFPQFAGNFQIPFAASQVYIRLVAAVKIGSACDRKAVFPGQPLHGRSITAPVGGVDGFQTLQTQRSQLTDQLFQLASG